ncbi:hypothetical protein [Streptomyces sp. NBC_00996]|uniref:hypothetical protein n=1 Tax=Streptomyces sp. NBC_00996 TaxID=2903710 RepID=UPI003869FB83
MGEARGQRALYGFGVGAALQPGGDGRGQTAHVALGEQQAGVVAVQVAQKGDGPGLTAWAADGKALRGAKDQDGKAVRLLAFMEHDRQLVPGQVQISPGRSAVPARQPGLPV